MCQAYLENIGAVVKMDEKLFRLSRKLRKLFESSSNCVLIFRLMAYIQKLISRNHLDMNGRELMIIIPCSVVIASDYFGFLFIERFPNHFSMLLIKLL